MDYLSLKYKADTGYRGEIVSLEAHKGFVDPVIVELGYLEWLKAHALKAIQLDETVKK